MKKLFSSMVLLTVLTCAVTGIVGCGEKPAKETVWKSVSFKGKNNEMKMLTFHRNGRMYMLRHRKQTAPTEREWDEAVDLGKYSINGAAKKISILDNNGIEKGYFIYTDGKDNLKLTKSVILNPPSEQALGINLTLTSEMSADEIKKLVN